MNNSQKFLLFLLIITSVAYVYFSFFNKDFKFPDFIKKETDTQYNPQDINQEPEQQEITKAEQTVKIYIVDKTGNLRSVNRTCNPNIESSCLAYAIKELVSAPSKWEKSKGFTSEIPQNTKVLSVRETPKTVLIDLSKDFENGGGTESTYYRTKQVIKTALANTSKPAYLYINGTQANFIGGDGIMIKQPLSERSLDE